MSLLLEVLRGVWMVGPQQQQAYFPLVASMLEAATNGKKFPAINDKGDLALDFLSEEGKFSIEVLGSSLNLERQNFVAGAGHIKKMLPDAPAGSIAVIPIKGEFMRYGTMCAWGADEIAPVIKMAADTENVAGIVLNIDSGGGAERAVPPFLQAIEYAQRKKKKPVVAHVDMCCSAGYYVASHCDYILANNKISSAVGSIGVMVSWVDFREHYKGKGITVNDIYAPQSKQKNGSYRALLDGNHDVLIEELRKSAATFISNVKSKRKNKFSSHDGIWEGEVFRGNDMKKHGLIDGFGDLLKACEIASALSEVSR